MLKEGLIYIIKNVHVVSSSIYQAVLGEKKVYFMSETTITYIGIDLPAFEMYKFEFMCINEIKNL